MNAVITGEAAILAFTGCLATVILAQLHGSAYPEDFAMHK
jgi:hypothetical protein